MLNVLSFWMWCNESFYSVFKMKVSTDQQEMKSAGDCCKSMFKSSWKLWGFTSAQVFQPDHNTTVDLSRDDYIDQLSVMNFPPLSHQLANQLSLISSWFVFPSLSNAAVVLSLWLVQTGNSASFLRSTLEGFVGLLCIVGLLLSPLPTETLAGLVLLNVPVRWMRYKTNIIISIPLVQITLAHNEANINLLY